MKKLIALAFLCFTGSSYAQFKLPVKLPGKQTEKQTDKKSAPSIKSDIEKVSRDLYLSFNNIKGDTLRYSSNIVAFESKIIPAGAKDCFILKHPYPNSYSWQATMYESENFSEAVAKYKSYYRQLLGSSITFHDNTNYKLIGEYDTPDEGRTFASTVMVLDEPGVHVMAFKIEIGLNYSFPKWGVSILIYEKMADEDLRPSNEIRIY